MYIVIFAAKIRNNSWFAILNSWLFLKKCASRSKSNCFLGTSAKFVLSLRTGSTYLPESVPILPPPWVRSFRKTYLCDSGKSVAEQKKGLRLGKYFTHKKIPKKLSRLKRSIESTHLIEWIDSTDKSSREPVSIFLTLEHKPRISTKASELCHLPPCLLCQVLKVCTNSITFNP